MSVMKNPVCIRILNTHTHVCVCVRANLLAFSMYTSIFRGCGRSLSMLVQFPVKRTWIVVLWASSEFDCFFLHFTLTGRQLSTLVTSLKYNTTFKGFYLNSGLRMEIMDTFFQNWLSGKIWSHCGWFYDLWIVPKSIRGSKLVKFSIRNENKKV